MRLEMEFIDKQIAPPRSWEKFEDLVPWNIHHGLGRPRLARSPFAYALS